ncbi:formate/nitrite transporter family protein [Jatrophihabitans fulvus]
MTLNAPPEIAAAAVASGTSKAAASPAKALVGGFLAGAYIAFGALLAIIASSGLDAKTWGGLITVVTGVVFSLGLILVVVGGADLLTGNMALIPMAVFAKKVTVAKMLVNWFWVTIGNLAGSLFVAYVLADKTGVIKEGGKATAGTGWIRLQTIAEGKGMTETHVEQFLRALGCNWLVCLAVWLALAATTVGGKILAIVFPITAFVALGFDHVVANMFFLPLAMFENTGITFTETLTNLIFAFLGNAVGAAVFVAGAYWYLYADDVRAADSSNADSKDAERAAGRK